MEWTLIFGRYYGIDTFIEFLKMGPTKTQPLFVPGQSPLQQGLANASGAMPMGSGQQSAQGLMNVRPNQGGPTVVPRSQIQTTRIPGLTAKAGNYSGATKL